MRLLLAPVAALVLTLAGCSSDSEKEKHLSPTIHIEAPDNGFVGSSGIAMPVTGIQFRILNRPVVPEGNFMATGVFTVGPADMRRNVLLVQVDNRAGDALYTMTGKARGKRLFLLVDDRPVGVHFVDNPVDKNIFFDVEVPGKTRAEQDNALRDLSDKLNEAILKIRKEKEQK